MSMYDKSGKDSRNTSPEKRNDKGEQDDRSYMRHPANIPIQYSVDVGEVKEGADEIYNISRGGLCFATDEPLPVGAKITIQLSLGDLEAEIAGVIAWVVKKEFVYDIGVKFLVDEDVFRFRLIEQVCAIAHYRNEIREKEGRELTNEEAAVEWISKYAASYPELTER